MCWTFKVTMILSLIKVASYMYTQALYMHVLKCAYIRRITMNLSPSCLFIF